MIKSGEGYINVTMQVKPSLLFSIITEKSGSYGTPTHILHSKLHTSKDRALCKYTNNQRNARLSVHCCTGAARVSWEHVGAAPRESLRSASCDILSNDHIHWSCKWTFEKFRNHGEGPN